MCKSFLLKGGNIVEKIKERTFFIRNKINKKSTMFFLSLLFLFLSLEIFNSKPVFYADAYFRQDKIENNEFLFQKDKKSIITKKILFEDNNKSSSSEEIENIIKEIVNDSPMREMIPYIAERDPHTAAFLVGIAKKESSFGFASPIKDGKTCYNYWGYKGSGQRGVGMGYACFATAQEAVQVVGDRISVLVSKNKNTPEKMVNTWKCGTTCKGDPGVPGWIATVSIYFDKILKKNA